MTPGEAASMNPGGAVIGGDAGVRELVAASVAEALETLLVAAVEEKAQRKKAQREKAQREWWRQREKAQREKAQREARLRCASRGDWAFLDREQRKAHFSQHEARFAD